MPKQKVFITRRIAQEALDKIALRAELEIWEGELPPPEELLRIKATDCTGLLTLLTDRVDATLMDAAPKLKVISNLAVGYDNIDIPAATSRQIVVGNTPEVLTETTADHTFSLLLATARRVVEANSFTIEGKWKTWGPMMLLGQDIHHATIGIIGLGRIGNEVAKRAKGFDMKVLYYDTVTRKSAGGNLPDVKRILELKELLSVSDFISLHVPLTSQTHHLIGAAEFNMMKPNAVLINTSRGAVVDQRALYQALQSRRIFAAGIDVTEIEPIPHNDRLLTLDNIIITPHIASATFATRKKMALIAADNLIAGLNNQIPPNCVNCEALNSTK